MKISYYLPRIFLLLTTIFLYFYFFKFYENETKNFAKNFPNFNFESENFLIFDKILQIFTLNQKPIVWLFWDNFGSMPAYIQLSFELIKCHNFPELNVIILNRTTVKNFVKKFPPSFEFLSKVHQADYCKISNKYSKQLFQKIFLI